MTRAHDPDALFTITDLATELGVTTRAIRFYEAKGLLEPRRVGVNRVYSVRDRARLLLILRGKRLGFSLAEIAEYLDLYDTDPTHQQQLVRLLAGLRQRIGELESQRRDLEQTLGELRDIEDQVLAAMRQSGMTPPPRAAAAGAR
jgi:DNA-binding transcriptional MerR regulator